MVARSPAPHTGGMADDARATAFVTGADGFLGRELVKVLVARGHQVFALTHSVEAAQSVRRAAAMPVMGDLLTPGRWQDEAGADWVFHLEPAQSVHPSRMRLASKRAASIARDRLLMDSHLLDTVGPGATKRIVYVADIRFYGAVGPRPITEDEPPRPSILGTWLLPTLDRLEGYLLAGAPIVTAFPGLVYGNGSWFRDLVMEPVLAGRRVLQFGTTGPLVSPIHLHDCARGLVHLVEHGAVGGRYFLVNNEPARLNAFAATFARIANRPLRVWRLPTAAARLVGGAHLAGHLESDAVFSNIRLRGTGFRFEYPTLEQGLRQLWESPHE
jgi:nucleoside-diphosphate-sugar epimerase